MTATVRQGGSDGLDTVKSEARTRVAELGVPFFC